jgi:methylphosphotriester-DNA--protein-cysteine methyltransferase
MDALAVGTDPTPLAFATDDERWDAVARRDRAADGRFFCAVVTTGVYCRPSCAGRPQRKNVRFYRTAAEAQGAGFRTCKRCRPNEVRA